MNYTKMSLKVKLNVTSLYFRCEIPVIIMGETGCGKTRLIKFMCALQQPPGVIVENMILMKVLYFDTKIELVLIRNVLILRIQYF